ncbi:MAG TPA: tetratricopeptide repeat protein [Pirellulales bacterium]|nr:tetratricopeptide repeat protein [Pirellulales bacterium]
MTDRTGSGLTVQCLFVLVVLALTVGASPVDKQETSRPSREEPVVADGEPAPADLEDRPDPLVERVPRSEADQDRLDATVLFASARAHEQRQDLEKALQLYERALQAEPASPAILRHVIVLAFNLDRRAEAARYAQLLESHDPDDTVLLRRLGLELADEEDVKGALALYRRVAAVEAGEKLTPNTVLLWMELGRLYFLTQQYALAAEQFEKIEQALANPAEVGLNDALKKVVVGKGELTYQLFGECYLEAGKIDEAQAAFTKSNEYKADAGLLAFNLARVAARRHQPAEALAQLDVALERGISGQGTEPYELLAQLLTDLGQSEKLIPRLEKLRAAKEDNIPLTAFLAQTYAKADKIDLAEPLYRQLCDTSRHQPPLDVWQGFIALLHKAGHWDELLPVLGEALAQANGWEPLGEAGKALLADKAAVDALLKLAEHERVADVHRDQSARWLAAALLSIARQQYTDANSYMELAIDAPAAKIPELLALWGMELQTHDQFARAAEVFRRGANEQMFPAVSPAFYYYLSGALSMTDQTDEAVAAARKAAELRPDSVRFESRIGWILYRAKRYDDARAAYEQVIAKFDKDPATADTRDVLHDVRLALSNIEISQNHPQRAEAWLEELWAEFPADPGVLNDLGYSWADQGKHLRRSLRMIEQAVAAEPKNLAFRDSLGWALYRLGRFPEAIVELRTATAVEKPDATVLDHLGDALSAAGQQAEARQVWQRAAAAYKADGEAAKGQTVQAKIDAAGGESDKTADPPPKSTS